jgi:hypothetical protein
MQQRQQPLGHRTSSISILLILYCAFIVSSCNETKKATNASGTVLASSEKVKKLADGCPAQGDYKGDTKLDGTYTLTQERTPWFKLPREENQLLKRLKWDDANLPLGDKVTLTHDKAALTVKFIIQEKDQEFKGSLFQDQRLCFSGPVSLSVEGMKVEANLFGDGKFKVGDSNSLVDVNITFGITGLIADPKKEEKTVGIQHELLGNFKIKQAVLKKTEKSTSGLFLMLKQPQGLSRHLFVEQELQLQQRSLTARAKQLRYSQANEDEDLLNPVAMRLNLPTDGEPNGQLELIVDHGESNSEGQSAELESETLSHCEIHLIANHQDLKGNFTCTPNETDNAEIASASGQFYIVGGNRNH